MARDPEARQVHRQSDIGQPDQCQTRPLVGIKPSDAALFYKIANKSCAIMHKEYANTSPSVALDTADCAFFCAQSICNLESGTAGFGFRRKLSWLWPSLLDSCPIGPASRQGMRHWAQYALSVALGHPAFFCQCRSTNKNPSAGTAGTVARHPKQSVKTEKPTYASFWCQGSVREGKNGCADRKASRWGFSSFYAFSFYAPRPKHMVKKRKAQRGPSGHRGRRIRRAQ